jgi:ABC-type lipoprotein export system ATPase subunit
MIQLSGITKQFGKSKDTVCRVFQDANLRIERGSSVAIKGRSGSGKSTLLNILAGLDLDYLGDYYYQGKKLEKDSDKIAAYRLKHIGIVTQNYRLLSDRTCYDNVAFPLKCLKKDNRDIHDKVEAIMTLLDVQMFKNRYPNELSGGQCQRIAIARAMVKSPDILLADEPTGALDEASEHDVLKVLDLLIGEGQTLVIATHSDLIAQYCKYRYEIVNFKIIENGQK